MQASDQPTHARECMMVGTHLADPADVFVSRLFVEPEVLVQSEADVVAVETVAKLLQVEEMLFEGDGDGRLQCSIMGVSILVGL